jgi:hypothetical protein
VAHIARQITAKLAVIANNCLFFMGIVGQLSPRAAARTGRAAAFRCERLINVGLKGSRQILGKTAMPAADQRPIQKQPN